MKSLAMEGKLPKLAGRGQTWGNKSAAEAHLAYGMALAAVDLFFQYHAELGIRNLLNNPDALAGITADLDRRMRESHHCNRLFKAFLRSRAPCNTPYIRRGWVSGRYTIK